MSSKAFKFYIIQKRELRMQI